MEMLRSPSLSPPNALCLVSPFFEREWARTDPKDIHIKRVTGGLINTLHLIRRDNAALEEPSAVLIRHFGLSGEPDEPPESSITLSSAQQATVYWEMGRRGWGPRVYGLIPGGRIEEYIDSHTLTAAEASQPSIARDVARSYARLHSLRLPLRRDGFQLVVRELSSSARTKREEVISTLLAIEDPEAREYATIFQDTDWTQELDWVSSLFQEHDCKVTVTHGDGNYLNLLVKKSSSSEHECRTVLIDYETVSYSYRGFDIGGHFNERMYCYNQPNTQLTGYDAPDREERRFFCEAYLQEMRGLEGGESSVYDMVDHLMLEADIGRMYQILFTNLMCMVFDEVENDPLFLSGLVHMMQMYWQLKHEFVSIHQV